MSWSSVWKLWKEHKGFKCYQPQNPGNAELDEAHMEQIYLSSLNSLRAQTLEKPTAASARNILKGSLELRPM